jgi:hypothetical protein
MASMSLRPACEHLLILENSPLPGLYDAQRRTWLRWAFADPGFDAERCLFIVSSSAPLGNSTEKQPQLRVVREMPAVETESGAHGNNKWARRMESLRVARAFNFSTLTVMAMPSFAGPGGAPSRDSSPRTHSQVEVLNARCAHS